MRKIKNLLRLRMIGCEKGRQDAGRDQETMMRFGQEMQTWKSAVLRPQAKLGFG